MNSSTSSPVGDQRDLGKPPARWIAGRWTSALLWIKGRARQPRLLFLDDDPARARSFLTEYPQAIWVETVPECIERLAETWDEVHLDHDLGGKTFVDTNDDDCGMEVIRWICKEPRTHLRKTLFYVHTHNSVAGLLMVLQMRASGYQAEFRPFGYNLARLLRREQPVQTPSSKSNAAAALFRRWRQRLFGWRERSKPVKAAENDSESISQA
jgi:hypothetical protein